MKNTELIMSTLPKTWIVDLDGTVVKHNGYLIDQEDTVLENSREFLANLPGDDIVIIITARSDEYRESTINMLKTNNIRYDKIIFDMPVGERILINDKKKSGLKTAYSINLERDDGINLTVVRQD